jgi:glycosyltransferase involved in cell wall biosynthesis
VKILHVSDRASVRGGADWHLIGIIKALAGSHDQVLAVGRDDGTATLDCPIEIVPGLDDPDRGAKAADLDALCAHVAPDVVHLHNAIGPDTLRWGAKRHAMATVHDHRGFCPGRGKLTLAGQPCTVPMSAHACSDCFHNRAHAQASTARAEERRDALAAMATLTVVSHYMKRQLIATGIDEQRVHVIPTFVHGLDLKAKADGPPCALFAGRLVDAKGPSAALEAWKRASIEGLPLVFAGTGAMRAPLEARGCDVLGWVPHEKMSALDRRAKVLIMPSRWQEPFGIVGLEALYMGVPIAAWESGGVSEWHPGGPGLTAWGDVDGLAAAIAHVVGRSAMMPEGFEQGPVMAQLLRIYEGMQIASS